MTHPAPSYVEHYLTGAFASYVRERRLAGSVASMIEVAQPAGDFSDPATTDLTIIRLLSGGPRQKLNFGGGPINGVSSSDDLCLVAPHIATEVLIDGPHAARFLSIPAAVLRPHLEQARAMGDPFDFGRLHAGPFRNAFILGLLDRLWGEAERGDAPSRLFADGAILAITAELLREAERPLALPRGGLAPWQVKRVTEYLSAHLAKDVTLADLAELAHLSPAHFCRAFKQSTGRSPVQQLIAMRIERAKALLGDPRLPVIEVAASCGYDSPSRFAQVFKRETGTSPSEWRRGRLS